MLQNILGALGTSLDVISATIFTISMGFSAMPTAIAFLVSGAGMLIFKQVAIASIPTEQVILINRFSKDRNERSCIILYSAVIMVVIGVTGIFGIAMDFVGEIILCAVMSGVGLMIFGISMGMIKENVLPSVISLVIAFLVYFLTQNLIYTAVASILLSALIYDFIKRKDIHKKLKPDLSKENFKLIRPKFNLNILRGSLALCTICIGGIISDATITSQLANIKPNLNFLSIINGASNITSAAFTGMPLGYIVSGTGSAPNPMLSGILVMVIMAILLFFKIIPRIASFIPSQSLCGFLCVLATLVVIPNNALTAFSGNPIVATVTTATTAFVDPFIGMVAGVLTRFITALVGM